MASWQPCKWELSNYGWNGFILWDLKCKTVTLQYDPWQLGLRLSGRWFTRESRHKIWTGPDTSQHDWLHPINNPTVTACTQSFLLASCSKCVNRLRGKFKWVDFLFSLMKAACLGTQRQWGEGGLAVKVSESPSLCPGHIKQWWKTSQQHVLISLPALKMSVTCEMLQTMNWPTPLINWIEKLKWWLWELLSSNRKFTTEAPLWILRDKNEKWHHLQLERPSAFFIFYFLNGENSNVKSFTVVRNWNGIFLVSINPLPVDLI